MNTSVAVSRVLAAIGVSAGLATLGGCQFDSFLDPSVSGYWENQPTVLPILSRLDAIESEEDGWGQTSAVSPEDLVPNDLSYRLVPGDFVTVQIYELYVTGQWAAATRRVDPGGFIRVQELGDVQAAGLTPQELEDALTGLYGDIINVPQVEVVLEEGSAFTYTVYGSVPGNGLYTLRDPDLRLLDALAVAGGVPNGVEKIYVIRNVELSDTVKPSFQRDNAPSADPVRQDEPVTPVDVEDLIDRLDDRGNGGGGFSPGVLRQDGEPAIDIEDLEPVRAPGGARVDIDDAPTPQGVPGSWVYIEERGEWVRVPGGDGAPGLPPVAGERPLYVERIIEVPAEELLRGKSKFNIVVRPDDMIHVEAPPFGVVYLEGEVARPGPYQIPPQGLTLSRAVAAAGGLGPLAIPEKVDLVRKLAADREAALRVNLGAIRHRTEPDIVLRADDHIIVGTNFWASPLAVIRNGFRMTYGFGFLLDRNFGNDVFGPPPTARDPN